MKRLTLTNVLFAAMLVAPAAFAGEYIPWHWDDEEHTVVQQAEQVQQQEADDEKWTSDIGW
jgi:hypothetical protein